MAEIEGAGKRKMGTICMQLGNYPKDLLQKFITGNNFAHKFEEKSEELEEIELTLGLSLNGRFGVDPKAEAKKLTRSSSIPDFTNVEGSDFQVGFPSLMRTCSLPTETEEEWKRRKELQTLRRMEAKRKRTEKQRNVKIARVPSFDSIMGSGGGGLVGLPPQPPPSQGSIGSQGSGSSGVTETDSQPVNVDIVGMNKASEARSPTSVQSLPENGQKPPVSLGTAITVKPSRSSGTSAENSPKKPATSDNRARNTVDVLEDMPSVFTKGDGTNGRRIQGFLYRYKKGEEVRIVCVCHGSFLSPAEFVKHAGGGDVAHPLKHIVVNPC